MYQLFPRIKGITIIIRLNDLEKEDEKSRHVYLSLNIQEFIIEALGDP